MNLGQDLTRYARILLYVVVEHQGLNACPFGTIISSTNQDNLVPTLPRATIRLNVHTVHVHIQIKMKGNLQM